MAWRFPDKPPRWVIWLLTAETIVVVPCFLLLALLAATAMLDAGLANNKAIAERLAAMAILSLAPLGQWFFILRWKEMADRVNPPEPVVKN